MNRFLLILCVLAVFAEGVPAASDSEAKKTPSEIRILADNEEYYFDSQQYMAEGNVRVTHRDTLLTADKVLGNPWTGDVEASGNVSFKSANRVLTGDSFTYNFKTEKGLAHNASANVDNVYFRGDELKSEPERYTLTGSRFTTCNAEEPHYYLSARELVIQPGKKLLARDVSLVFFGGRLFNIPKYSMGLGEKKESESALPAVGISGKYGIHAGYEFDLATGPRTIGALDLRLSTRQVLQGGVTYDRIAGRPVFLRATYRQAFYGGTRPDIMLSRLPEIGVQFSGGSGAEYFNSAREPLDLSRGLIDPLASLSSHGRLNTIGEVGLGKFIEEPYHISSERTDARILAWLDPIPLDSRTIISPGISGRLSHYGKGDDYTALGFRLAVARRLGSNSFVSLTYITHSIHGSTPFEFDEIELPDELAAKVRFPVGSLSLELGGRYDLRGHKFFDTEVSVAKVVHCIEPKITWRKRFQEFSIGVGLVGF